MFCCENLKQFINYKKSINKALKRGPPNCGGHLAWRLGALKNKMDRHSIIEKIKDSADKFGASNRADLLVVQKSL